MMVTGRRSSSRFVVAAALCLQVLLLVCLSHSAVVVVASSGQQEPRRPSVFDVLTRTRTRIPSSSALALQIPRGGARGAAAVKQNIRIQPQRATANNQNVNNKGVSSSSSSTASSSSLVFNLVKAILGVGVLSLPAGIANFGNAPSALIPALTVITVLGALSGYGFSVIGKVCHLTGASSYREAWSASVGPKSSWIPAASTTCKTFFACLAISMVLADTLTGLLRRSPETERTKVLVTLTLTLLLPLCWLKNLSALAPFSLVGILGMLYTAVAMTVRYLDGSYATSGGALSSQVPSHWRPYFGSDGAVSALTNPRALILVCMLSTAYMAHFIAPKVYQELKQPVSSKKATDTTPDTAALARFNTVVGTSFGICIALFAYITAIGFLTFGGHSDGLILNNYAASDSWMAVSKVAVAVSLVFSYPLVFTGCRDGALDLLGASAEQKSQAKLLNTTTIILLAVVTALAAALKDVSFVLAVAGATLGNALTYIYPALMYNAIVKKQNKQGESVGLLVSNVSAVLGVVMGAIGTKMALDK